MRIINTNFENMPPITQEGKKLVSTLESLCELDTEGIVALIRESGIKGVRTDAACCILTNYLRFKSGVDIIEANRTEVSFNDGQTMLYIWDLPHFIREVIRKFDAGLFPDLEM